MWEVVLIYICKCGEKIWCTGVYRERESRPGLRGHPCRFMPRAFVCTRDEIGGIWFDDLVLPPLGGDVPENE